MSIEEKARETAVELEAGEIETKCVKKTTWTTKFGTARYSISLRSDGLWESEWIPSNPNRGQLFCVLQTLTIALSQTEKEPFASLCVASPAPEENESHRNSD